MYNTKILLPTETNIELCAKELFDGEVIAFATETVYGLGANIFNTEAVSKIFKIKNRPPDNPLIVHVPSVEDVRDIAAYISDDAYKLLYRFSPGPLTLILKKKQSIPYIVTAGADTVAVRVPDNKVAIKLLTATGFPLAAPSANTSTRPSPTCAKHVMEDLNGKIKFILQSEDDCQFGLESTIVDMSGEHPTVLRLGSLPTSTLLDTLPNIKIASSIENGVLCPGTKYRHYAPNIKVDYVAFNKLTLSSLTKIYHNNKNTVILTHDEVKLDLTNFEHINMGSIECYAKNLFSIFRECEKKYQSIIAIGVSDKGIGRAINNRIIKASK
ncbi:MAG: threonylcarbamoyl-AMP synthase [Clostridiales bacterium]|jgi:L-threonylcarbamoyladenylate synthase|nr:threonylcarbamoyl-AMP synthase [Clostridiales bacterium]